MKNRTLGYLESCMQDTMLMPSEKDLSKGFELYPEPDNIHFYPHLISSMSISYGVRENSETLFADSPTFLNWKFVIFGIFLSLQIFTFTPVLSSCISWDQRSVQSLLSRASRPSSLLPGQGDAYCKGDILVVMVTMMAHSWWLSTLAMKEESSLPSSTKALTTPLCHEHWTSWL